MVCLATVSSQRFLPGTLVMIHSFLKWNPAFDGEIVILHEDLPEAARGALSGIGCRISFRKTSPELAARIADLVASRPLLAERRARFLSLDAFGLSGHDRILLCDSDILFVGAVDEMLARPEPLLCAADGALHRGNGRDPDTFAEAPALSPETPARTLYRPFNAGLLLFHGALACEGIHGALLDHLRPERWRDVVTPHTDQVVLNRHFAGIQTLLPASYNYLLAFRSEIFAATGIRLTDARVLHFNGSPKPWETDALATSPPADPGFLQACRRWYETWTDALVTLQARRVRGGIPACR